MSHIGKALNGADDIYIENDQWVKNTDTDNVAQNVRTRFLLFAEEWIYDLNEGVPYFEEIFGATPNYTRISTILRAVIMDTDGVDKIVTFELNMDHDTRKLVVTFTATTIYGTTIDYSDTISINGGV